MAWKANAAKPVNEPKNKTLERELLVVATKLAPVCLQKPAESDGGKRNDVEDMVGQVRCSIIRVINSEVDDAPGMLHHLNQGRASHRQCTRLQRAALREKDGEMMTHS